MTLIEGVLKDHVFIDFGAEIMYGADQMYLDHPCRFATVTFELMATSLLCEIADRTRKNQGMKPMHPMDEYTEETCDQKGFYDFYIGLNDWSARKCDSCIEFIVVNSDSEDNEELYTIDLGRDEEVAMYNRLDEQCRQHLGKSCADLLAEAKRRMEEDQ